MTYRILGVAEHELALSLVEPFQSAFLKLVDEVNLELADVDRVAVRIESCRRDYATQAALYAKGRRLTSNGWKVIDRAAVETNAPPGRSAHEYGEAGHPVLHDPMTGLWLHDSHPRWLWLAEKVEAHGLVSGARFKHSDGTAFFDASHVESPDWRVRAKARGYRGLE